ncbi:MAG: RagB/SusD family nutrient uptake outer membrane protein [Cytophagales bacterium]|uniref:RagB/SusD family nutrient uptake outer membrane protein n=1 Tax=Cyclobacterium marinum TaxID=104 RepID=UPI0011EF6764|nr:RagB/SusD family nutrient uptake outer membrane protein [Cyclobacterium marinum]MBI0397277.1 RagB/SusD family nutrient uptake outer membrane protein [Cyclobacterium marinum]MBR9777226.1 RagB/SusD family nutrient uptake outer membrane protein [Cytophagales bacterium]|tara:strand:- start:27757 stop:29214 length:1458 start_codon:yes stop_codon:yes gene_type:complete
MKNKIIYILSFLVLGFYSCNEDELDLYPKTQITEGNFYQNEEQLVLAVNDIYRQLGRIYNAQGIADLYGELRSDNTYIEFTGGSTTFSEEITDYYIRTNNGLIENAWETCYNAIFICNNAIYQLDNADVAFTDPDLKERLKAEATLVRSLIFFNMVRVWGGIPLPLKPLKPEEGYEYLRESKEVVYQQIISDLKYAKTNLPESYSGNDVGRVTKFGASAILAKVYLTLGENQNASIELKEIIESERFSLDANDDGNINADDYEYLFLPDTKNSKASLLEAQYLGGENSVNSNHQSQYTPFHWAFHLPGMNETFRGNGMNTPTQNLADEFEADDVLRKNISIYPGYLNLDTDQFIEYPFTMKFYDPNWRYPGQNFEIIRYADVLLMYSEVTNDPSYLNMVRARVGLPGFGQEGYPEKYNTLTLAIEHERRVELCFEFHRFFDLVRTGRAVEVLQSNGFDINQDKLLFPIPLRAIDVNNNITQNPGY